MSDDHRPNHMETHLKMALEISSLIDGSRATDDPGVKDHLAQMAGAWVLRLYERLERVREHVEENYPEQSIREIDEAADNVVPIRKVAGEG